MADEGGTERDVYLEKLKRSFENCNKCEEIAPHITNKVWGYGPNNAMILVVGEAPGAEEDALGKPFVGASGSTLTEILAECGIPRDAVYITNCLLCRPTLPGTQVKRKNRAPNAKEISNCKDRLISEILCVDPVIILALGKTASNTLLGRAVSLEKIRGEVIDVVIETQNGLVVKYPMLSTYHPSYLMAHAKPNDIFLSVKDIKLLKEIVVTYMNERGKE